MMRAAMTAKITFLFMRSAPANQPRIQQC
jgi:hypothetical protein